ncbi:hypothetical protein ACQP2T_63500 (plasmid) [Nonomuraea sp. CA-143628]|uniref:hypothetical protein n=1 Tax=Nonomuraea sp. CA-143628 TaxID=3239997 RepID=UPI003D90557C
MRISKSASLLAAVFVALALFGVPASAVSAVAPGDVLRIVEVGTDAMGADSYANRNREFVKFQNVSSAPVDVAGVLVEDNWAHSRTVAGDAHTCNTYKIVDLPSNATTMVQPGEYVTVFNGSRWGGNRKVGAEYQLFANSDTDCGTFGQFYNNDADTAWVTKANGTDVYSSKSWDWNGGYTVKP